MIKYLKKISFLKNYYIIIACLSILILSWVLQLWKATLSLPFAEGTDALFNLVVIKTLADNGWYFHNDFIGAPFGLDFHDFPSTEMFHLLILRLFVVFVDSVTALNLFFLLSFLLTAVSSFFVLKRLKISSYISLVISLIYTFLPYSFLRGQAHVFLAAYYTVPLITLVILSLWSNNLPLFSSNHSLKGKVRWNILNHQSIFCIVICLFLGLTGVYYAFFACFFIVVACVSAFLSKKDKRIFICGIILITLICAGVFLHILPSIIYIYQHGVNEEVAQRDISDAEVYGLKIIHLLLPIQNHRLPLLKNLVTKYLDSQPPLQNENASASLGLIGSIGFLSLLLKTIFSSFITKANNCLNDIYDRLALLNISALFFATIGGFGSLFSLLLFTQIRGVNRISIFIAFFSLLAVALFLDDIKNRYVNNKTKTIIFNLSLLLLLWIGIVDQTSPAFTPNYAALKDTHISDRGFVQTIERLLPTGSMVFQLPHVPFPEHRQINNMLDYDLFRGYLHSKNLRWSYGAMKGRNLNWHQLVSEEPIDILLSKISMIGFSGIYLDQDGYSYSDRNKIVTDLENKLGVKPIVSENGRLMFFNMKTFNEELRNRYTSEQLEVYKWAILNPLTTQWKKGFYDQETSEKEGQWRWSTQEGKLIIKNLTSKTRETRLSMALASGGPAYSNLRIESDLFSEVVSINNKQSVLEKTIFVSPGKHTIKFVSDAKQGYIGPDLRKLFFRVLNFKLQEKIPEYEQVGTLKPTELEWKDGFYNLENNLSYNWRWSQQKSTLKVSNPSPETRKIKLNMTFVTGWKEYSNLRIESNLLSETLRINNKPLVYEKVILVPPGKHKIKFLSDAKQVKFTQEDRQLFFSIHNFQMKENLYEYYKLGTLKPTEIEWKDGFYKQENILGEKWRWSNKQSTLIISNPTVKTRKSRLSMSFLTEWPEYSNLRIDGDLFSEVVKINNQPSVFEKTILLPPGKHIINFSSEAQQIKAPQEQRKLFFRINEAIF